MTNHRQGVIRRFRTQPSKTSLTATASGDDDLPSLQTPPATQHCAQQIGVQSKKKKVFQVYITSSRLYLVMRGRHPTSF